MMGSDSHVTRKIPYLFSRSKKLKQLCVCLVLQVYLLLHLLDSRNSFRENKGGAIKVFLLRTLCPYLPTLLNTLHSPPVSLVIEQNLKQTCFPFPWNLQTVQKWFSYIILSVLPAKKLDSSTKHTRIQHCNTLFHKHGKASIFTMHAYLLLNDLLCKQNTLSDREPMATSANTPLLLVWLVKTALWTMGSLLTRTTLMKQTRRREQSN